MELTCLKCTVRLDIAGLIDADVESLDQCNALEEYLSIFYNIFRKQMCIRDRRISPHSAVRLLSHLISGQEGSEEKYQDS